jgi:hypothetical protein
MRETAQGQGPDLSPTRTPRLGGDRAAEPPAETRSAPPRRTLSVSTAQRIQSAAGNRALAGMIAQRRATASPVAASPSSVSAATPTTAEPAAESPEPDLTPERDAAAPAQRLAGVPVQRLQRPPAASSAKFSSLKSDVKSKQKTLATHASPAAKAGAAQAAAKPPADDKQAQGKAANAEKMNAAQPGSFDKAAFIAAVNKAISEQAPKNLDEADNFGDSGKADAVKGQVQGQVGQGKEQSAKQIDTTTKATPDTSAAKEKPVTPLTQEPAPGNPGTPNPENAIPDKAPASATDLSAGPRQVDQQMADSQVTEEQLAESNEPEFTGALKEKKAGEEHAATAPRQVRAAENHTLTDAKADAKGAAAGSIEAMRGQKQAANNAVGQGQQGAQSQDEQKRAQVTAKLQAVFDTTQKDVEGILTGLDKKVDDAFSTGEKAARDAFTAEHKRKMDEYKDKRYSGFTGKLKWVKDKFTGLPQEANQIFVTARQGYVTRMQGVISNVADAIGAELNRAKQRIATGRQQLQAEVAKLPADLQAIGKKAAGEFSGKFDELTANVDAKGQELVQTLASKYNEALKSVDAEIEAEKEKNKGLIAKAVDAVKGVIDTIMQLKDLLLGVLQKAAQAVMAILKDPIGFLGNLVSAVGAGLKAFISNIGTHVKKGLIGWLLGSMANAGIQLPDKFDLRGILSMIASLLGLTWAAIRGRIVQKGIPEKAMTAVEASVPIIAKLQSGGVAGAYEEIKEQVGDLKENLLDKISKYLIPTVLIAGITWIISLLNPASAFIKACKMIIDIVTFIIDRGAQIIEFVNAVLDAVIAIAGGGAGGVPARIEAALAKSIPVLIGALAAILGIGGIAAKVKSFFQALSKPVMKAVDWIVGKIVALGKKIWAKMTATGKKIKDKSGHKDAGKHGKPGDRTNVETPRNLMPGGTFHLTKTSSEFNAELAQARNGQVIHQIGGDPQQVTRSLLAAHPDASYDKASGTLKLPKATVGSPSSLSDLGSKVAADTGVSKVEIHKKGETVQIVGSINPATPVGQATAPPTNEEAVRAAILEHKIIKFLDAMASGSPLAYKKDGANYTVDMAAFELSWRDTDTRNWVKEKFRDVLDGTHEWLPCEHIVTVVQKQAAANLTQSGHEWIKLQNDMRSPTQQIVYHPDKIQPKIVKEKQPDGSEREYSVPQGHVGAVYYPTVASANQQVVGRGRFHRALHDAFMTGTTPKEVAQNAYNVAMDWAWNGISPITPDIHPDCRDKNGTQVTGGGQKKHIDKIDEMFKKFI